MPAMEPMEVENVGPGPRTFALRAHGKSVTGVAVGILVVTLIIVGGALLSRSGQTTTTTTTTEKDNDKHKKETCEALPPSQADFNAGFPETDPSWTVAMGEKATVKCAAGFEPEQEEVTCVSGRILEPVPACVKAKDWCPKKGKEGGPPDQAFVPAAALGEKVKVTCGGGFEAKVAEVKCGKLSEFYPEPACGIKGECPKFVCPDCAGLPRTEHATAPGEMATVICTPGFAPEKEKVTCGQGAVLDSEPACVHVEDWCLGQTGDSHQRPNYPAAALGAKVKVTCGNGFQAKDDEVTCGSRSHFQPKPECVQIEVRGV